MKAICITPIRHLPGLYEKFESICDFDYFPNISYQELKLILDAGHHNSIFTNPNKQNFIIDKQLLKKTAIRLINTASTGLNHINLKDCKDLDISVLSLTKDYSLIRNLPSTSELAFGLFLSLARKIPTSFDSVKSFNWDYEPFVGRQIMGMTAGIVGYGRLGTYMARYCKAFGMKVIVYDPFKNVFDHDQVEKRELLERSDLISLHVHVKQDTIGFIDEDAVRLMKRKPFIVNTSRGEIVDESSIYDAIKDESIAGYGTDVLVDEFREDLSENALINLSRSGYNVIITPHIGGMSLEGQKLAYSHAINKFREYHEQ
ncbi:hypothetical protein CL614_09150 [archaeon]|nr:hypothetical protein [archaeon]|tara:strand:+ start:418 stop:1365 length:948 start_codon:yes stop_codon:yes gene_type:complete